MEVIIKANPELASQLAAQIIAHTIEKKPNTVLGLATGATPLSLYQELINLHKNNGLDFSRVHTFNLDEYVGVAPNHPASYHFFMEKNLFSNVNIPNTQRHIPDGMACNIPQHCIDYENRIRQVGGIDIQILGIGSDGHIGFNEPSSSLASRTRIKTLAGATLEDNKKYFHDLQTPPRHAITMGIGTIMEAKDILLLAFGSKKAQIVSEMVEGPISAMVPASVLQMHPSAKIILDEESAALLKRRDYYNDVYRHKPAWQKFE